MKMINGHAVHDKATHYAMGRVYGIYYKVDGQWWFNDSLDLGFEILHDGAMRNGAPLGRGDNPVIELPR